MARPLSIGAGPDFIWLRLIPSDKSKSGFALSIILASLLLPVASEIIDQDISVLMTDSQTINLVLPACTLLFGVLSGLYPAIYISSFDPLKVLKGSFHHSRFGISLRQGLVVFQFVISSVTTG